MKQRTVQSQILVCVITGILLITFIIGGISIYEVDRYVQESADAMVLNTCEKEAVQINDLLDNLESSVHIMESYVLSHISSAEDLKDAEHREEVIRVAEDLFFNIAGYTEGCETFYLRFNPEFSTPTAGFFVGRDMESGQFVKLESTDLSAYSTDDRERVGWYWEPVNSGKPIWIMPYFNKNYEIDMISYCIPLYQKGELLGVVGMDFDYRTLTERTGQIEVYENGYAYIAKEGKIVYHPFLQPGERAPLDDEKYLQKSCGIDNGMELVLAASYDDIRAVRNEITIKIVGGVVILSVLFSLIAVFLTKKIVSMLDQLTEAAQNLSEGNYDVKISSANTKEVMELNRTFEIMADRLRKHDEKQQKLAFRDSLTGLRNSAAYKAWVAEFNKELKENGSDFGVGVLDINYLKKANDTFGHAVGDKLIAAASKIIAETFKRSPVFRIGGDEFVVILQNDDLANIERLTAELDERCENAYIEADHVKIPIRIAMGVSIYSAETDTNLEDVFNHADDKMYGRKRAMKAEDQR